MRYFRTANDATYEHARSVLDSAWGHPTPDGRIVTCIEPAATAPRDPAGRIILAVQDEFCEFSLASELLPMLLTSGAVEEIDAATYHAALPKSP